MSKKRTVSIIIPAYNEATFISQVVEKVSQADTLGLAKEIIAVDDGSTDKTASILKRLKPRFPNLKVIHLPRNLGKGAAVKRALLKSTGGIIIIQDADLEYSPDDYPTLLQPIISGLADVVYGSRFISHRPHRVLYFWHYQANKWLTTLSNMFTNLNLTDMETGFKVFRGDLLRQLAPSLKSQGFNFEPEVTAKIAKQPNLRIYEVGISYHGRTYEEGKKINWVDGIKAAVAIVYFHFF